MKEVFEKTMRAAQNTTFKPTRFYKILQPLRKTHRQRSDLGSK